MIRETGLRKITLRSIRVRAIATPFEVRRSHPAFPRPAYSTGTVSAL
jgi:hypothetical protein